MAKKYIDAEKLIAEINRKIGSIENRLKEDTTLISEAMLKGSLGAYESIEPLINSLQQVQPEFPTTDEEIEIFLATHPKVEVPPKYKTLDWLLKKQEQPEVDLNEETETWISTHIKVETGGIQQVNTDELAKAVKEWGKAISHHFYELGLKAKEG